MVVPAFFPVIITASILFLLSCAYAQPAYRLTTIQYGAFTKTATYSIASSLNFFGHVGLDVQYQQIPNSTFGYSQLLNGGYDVLTGTIDNAVNLRFNSQKPVTVLGQLDGGPDLVIASVPSIKSIQDLRGHPIIVDSPISGYAYVLRKVLSLYGLRLENGDYTFQVGINMSPKPETLLTSISDCRWHTDPLRGPRRWDAPQWFSRLRHDTCISIHCRSVGYQRCKSAKHPRYHFKLHPAAQLYSYNGRSILNHRCDQERADHQVRRCNVCCQLFPGRSRKQTYRGPGDRTHAEHHHRCRKS